MVSQLLQSVLSCFNCSLGPVVSSDEVPLLSKLPLSLPPLPLVGPVVSVPKPLCCPAANVGLTEAVSKAAIAAEAITRLRIMPSSIIVSHYQTFGMEGIERLMSGIEHYGK